MQFWTFFAVSAVVNYAVCVIAASAITNPRLTIAELFFASFLSSLGVDFVIAASWGIALALG